MIMDTHYKTILGMAFLLISVNCAMAQEKVHKTIEKSFPFTNSGEFQIENKYVGITSSTTDATRCIPADWSLQNDGSDWFLF